MAIAGLACAFIAASYLFSSDHWEADDFYARVLLVAVAGGIAAIAIGNLVAINRATFGVFLFVMNAAVIFVDVTLVISEYRSGSPDLGIWTLLAIVLILNLAMLVRLRSVNRAIELRNYAELR